MSPSAPPPVVPPAGTVLDDGAARRLAAELDTWVADLASRLVDLDADAQASGDDALRTDVAAAFTLWRAVSERAESWDGVGGANRDHRARLLATAWTPLTADTGEVVADNLADAVTFLDALVGKLAGNVTAAHQAAAGAATAWVSVDDDLRHAAQAAARLGQEVRHVADLEADAGRRSRAVEPPAELAQRAAAARARLDVAEAERQDVLRRLQQAASSVAGLQRREQEVRALAATCREKIADAPRLAVPSIAALGPAPDGVADRPWPAIRAGAVEWLRVVDRAGAALDEAERRFRAPLARRDELRGLLQAFRDKAASAGLSEHEQLDPRYAAARDLLWAAPCNLAEAEALVDEYVRTINQMMHGVN